MPIDSKHPDYEAAEDRWQRIRDVMIGHDAMVDGGTRYLPALSGQTVEEYAAYQQRAVFHDATSRTVDGLVGSVFRKPPKIEVPQPFEPLVESLTNRGVDAALMVKAIVREVIEIGRYGVLVDMPAGGGNPFAVGYKAEDIVNWREAVIDGKPQLVLVVLRETAVTPAPDDRFETRKVERFRVLEFIAEEGAAPVYQTSVYERREDAQRAQTLELIEGPIIPRRRGTALASIPFQFFAPSHLRPDVAKSPIQGLALTNIAHWQTSADLKHGAHFTALPTPWIAGEFGSDADSELRIGSSVAWKFEPGATVGMLEFTGAGLAAVRQVREDEKQDMAVLGARLLEDQKAAAEAAATVSLRHRGENSVLAGIVDTIQRGFTNVLDTAIWWAGGAENASTVTLNKDFIEAALSPQDMVQLVAGWQQGGYGGEVLFKNLRDGERLPEDMTFEDWQRDIEQNGPSRAVFGSFGDLVEDEADDEVDAAA